jgi:lipid-binding SYLF domain-containing protein
MEDPENYIPPSLIIQSEGIVILPSAFKLAFGVAGGQGARGIALTRKADRSWSDPFFVSMGEGSLGLQLGAQKSDIILLFKDKNDILGVENSDITLGGDIGVAAGPVSRGSSATTDISFDSEIYSYYRSRGLFAGISFKGGVLSYNENINESLYRMNDNTSDVIFDEQELSYNDNVFDLIDAINMYGE